MNQVEAIVRGPEGVRDVVQCNVDETVADDLFSAIKKVMEDCLSGERTDSEAPVGDE